MNQLRYRRETLPAALNAWKMPHRSPFISKLRFCSTWLLLVGLIMLALVVIQERPISAYLLEQPPIEVENAFVSQLADARTETAKLKLEQNRPDEALALIVSALKRDPTSEVARNFAESILRETIWNLPTLSLKHSMPIDQLAFVPPSSLWISLGGKDNTTVRWDLNTPLVKAVLFPTEGSKTRCLVLDPVSKSIVIQRNSTTLLCNADSLKPIRNLGNLPDDFTPSSVIVFSKDGLLMAHPAFTNQQDRTLVWHIRDTATGEIIRTTETSTTSSAPPLAAFLDRARLRLITADSGLIDIPVSPVEPITTTPLETPIRLLHAQFSTDGNSILTLQDMGSHQTPIASVISMSDEEDESLEIDALVSRFSWNRFPNLWNGLMKNPENSPFVVDDKVLKILRTPHAPIETKSAISALVFYQNSVIIGENDGSLTSHKLLPLPGFERSDHPPVAIDDKGLAALDCLCRALAANKYNESQRTFERIATLDRIKAFETCDFDAVFGIFPQLDFLNLIKEFKATPFRIADPSATLPLSERIAQSEPYDATSQELTELITAFHSQDSAAVLTAIQTAGSNGPILANALALSLQSNHPDWIQACINQATNLPPSLRHLSQTRISWLLGRKADSLSTWPVDIPNLSDLRLREDWIGWEQADFKPAFENLSRCMKELLASIKAPKNSTPEQRKILALRIAEPGILAAVGKPRFAEACLELALALQANKEEASTTCKLARTARNLGAPEEPCLRTEALALADLGDFKNARACWVKLITEFPVTSHLPGDYSEAAYSAFENADPKQAIEILNTGIRRFSKDADFALRAGWIALLSGNYDRAYHFLTVGQRIGFSPDKLENAMILLVISASQCGAADEAANYFQDLLEINPAWESPETLDSLAWPEELKASLRNFSQPPVTPDLLPELEPTNP